MEKYEKTLTRGLTYEKLYRQNEKNIWFLAWVLKQRRCNPDFNQQILSTPFTVKRQYLPFGQLFNSLSYKNGQRHGLERGRSWNDGLTYESHWQNNKMHGLHSVWHMNGNFEERGYFRNGELHGLFRKWYRNGQLKSETNWQNGIKHGVEREWYEGGNFIFEYWWKNGKRRVRKKKSHNH